MSARDTIVICPQCEHENEPDQRFCDECGAELKGSNPVETTAVADSGAQKPLPPGTALTPDEGPGLLVQELLSLGRVNRYLAQRDGQHGLLLEESATNPGFLENRLTVLSALGEMDGLWWPAITFHQGEQAYAFSCLPTTQTLAALVQAEGSLSAEALRELAEKLAETMERLHSQGFLFRSFQPDRVWWAPGSPLLVDGFERISPTERASEDFQVVNGFSAPEAYGVGPGQVGAVSDLYSAGALLHYAATGKRTDLESRENFFNFEPLPDQGDRVLQAAIQKMTAKTADERLQSAADLLRFLALAEVPSEPTPAAPAGSASGRPAPSRASDPSGPAEFEGDYLVVLRSHIGCVRKVNQDACLELRFTSIEKSEPTESRLVVVVDGMGGEAEGDKAASLALRTLANQVIETRLCLKDQRVTTPLMPDSPSERNLLLLERALKRANRTIFDYAERDSARRGMGCTVTACLLEPEGISIGHVGDTRAYLMRDGALERLTTDHSLVGRLVEMGQLTEEEARNSPQRSIIYRAMGTNPEVEVDLVYREIQPGDRFMLASDGVWEYFEHGELAELLASDTPPESLADRLVEICLERGADDNATLALIWIRK